MEFAQEEKRPVYRVVCDVSGTLYVELSPEQTVEAVYTLERDSATSDRPRHR